MATILRVKRSLSEDPANAIVVLSKRFKISDGSDNFEETSKIDFEFIGTVSEENEDVEKEIISKASVSSSDVSKKSEKNFRQNVKFRQTNVTGRQRTEQREARNEHRLKLVNRRRAIDAEERDPAVNDEVKDLYRLYDVIEDEDLTEKVVDSPKNVITCNGVPLLELKTTQRTTYDLYFSTCDLADVDHIVSIEKCSFEADEENWLVPPEESSSEGDDDSNDENNWRNDYPDENDEFEKERDYYRDYDDDEEEIVGMIASCTMEDDVSDISDDSMDLATEPKRSYSQFKMQMQREFEGKSDSESDSDF